MTLVSLRDAEDEETIQDRACGAIETYHADPDELIGPGSDPISKLRRLDVDAVLARSLRSVTADGL